MSQFVDALKDELESTFKEEISVYFDINPYDGLLETHDVDASLKEKLKCLVFIPIVSRTYCDPKSYSWEHELKAFVEQASLDQYGLKVKLPDGNVASRVLPVRIHNLDVSDIELLESLLGGVLRGIEFIYKEPGVNRPLKPDDDEKINLNKTKYRNQVNKVANAIKEIISGLRNPDHSGKSTAEKPGKEIQSSPKNLKTKMLAGSLLFIALIAAGYFLIPEFSKTSKRLEKSVAVLPFHNYSENPEEYMSDGLTDEIINHLYKIKSFDKVVSLSTVMTYKGTDKKMPQIANELKVNYILEGSYKKIGDHVRVNAQLVDPKKDRYLWQQEYDQPYTEIIGIQADIALQIAAQVKAYLTSSERQKIKKNPTVNPEAYNLYMQGRYLWNKRTREGLLKSIEFFEKSVAEDPGYALAYAGLADSYSTLVFWDWLSREEGFPKAKEFALKAIEMDPDLAEAHAILGDILMWSEWNWDKAVEELKLATELDPNCAVAHQYYSEYLDIIRNYGDAREQINIALRLDPVSSAFNASSALYYYNEGKFPEAVDACLKLMKINPDFTKNYYVCCFSYMAMGNDSAACEVFQQLLRRDALTSKYAIDIKNLFSQYGMKGVLNWIIQSELMKPVPWSISLAWAYMALGNKEEALNWLEKALKEHATEIPRINSYYIFNTLRSEPRFMAIIEKIGLAEYVKKNY